MKHMKYFLVLIMTMLSLVAQADKKKVTWPTDSAYIAQRIATITAMDSILKNVNGTDALMRFADIKCREFENDPQLMRPIASLFATSSGLIDLSVKRYQEIKKLYPNDFESYSDYAATMFDFSIKVNPNSSLTRDPYWFNLAKAQIDSAKVALSGDKRPYLWWITRCTFYAYNDSMQFFINNEVEDLRKKFPNNNADYDAAKILGNYRDYPMNMTNFEHEYLENGDDRVDKWFYQAETKRSELAQFYYDKADINTLTSDELTMVSNFYYESTETKSVTRADRAVLYKKGLLRAALGMKKFPENDNFKYLQLWHAAELAKYHFLVANSDSVKKNYGEERKWDELDLCNTYATQALQAYDSLKVPVVDSIDYKAVLYAAMAKQYSGKYEDAIQLYSQALNNMQYVKLKNRAPLYKAQYHDLDSLTAYQNMSDCYKSMNDYQKAIVQLNAVFDLRKEHGGQLKRTDLLDLIKLYRPIGSDEDKTQQERFAAYVACDSLYAMIQDSIDAGNKLFDNIAEGFVGMYPYNRLGIRASMDRLSDYAERDNYLVIEMAEEIYRRIEPLPEKSENETNWIGGALGTIWRDYYKKEDYRNALKYINKEVSYDSSKKERYKKTLDALAKLARKQR